MIKKLLTCSLLLCMIGEYKSQCATNSAPTNNCTFGDQISVFTLDGITAAGNGGCGANGYNSFPTPVWNLVAGTNYSWAATVGSGQYNQGVSIWIDYNNNGQFDNAEQVAVTPAALNHNGNFTVPLTAVGGNVKMRVRCAYNNNAIPNTAACTNGLSSFGETEDYNVNVIPPPPCQGIPSANSVLAPTYSICPGNGANIALANAYTVTGITYQWYSSTLSPVGLWTSIPTATNPTYSTGSQTINTWYQAVVSCGGVPTQTLGVVNLVSVSPVIINEVPYEENFDALAGNNTLPNCSWAASNMPTINQTYTVSNTNNRVPRSGNGYATFRWGTNPGGDYYYTNGIQLYSGITYSAGAYYITDGYTGWSDFSVLYGTTQTSVGLTAIATKTGSMIYSPFYQVLSNTFQVPTSGIYYMAIKCIGNGSPAYFTFDDVFINIPCDPAVAPANVPTLNINASATSVCEGEMVNFSATGADTYSWSTGSTNSSISETPIYGPPVAVYNVVGTSSLSGCSTTSVVTVIVNKVPAVMLTSSSLSVCPGTQVLLSALGAASYTWGPVNVYGSDITVSPTVATTYTVNGSDGNGGCIGTAMKTIGVHPLPTVNIVASPPSIICAGENAVLQVNGNASTFQWVLNNSPVILGGNPITVNPNVTTTYSVTGTDANGCKKTASIVQNVDACTGLNELKTASGIRIYPNPTSGLFTVEMRGPALKTIEVTDLTGRMVMTASSSSEQVSMNINSLAGGIYYVKVQSEKTSEVIKIVKQ